MNRQFIFYMKYKTAMKNNLISILYQTYPGANTYFNSPARSDDSQKWVDFASTYWHVDCVRKMFLNAFITHYEKSCKRKKYNFSQSKDEEIYEKAKELVPILPKDELTKLIIRQMSGVDPSLDPQLMAEIDDVTRFTHKGVITAFAGIDPGVNESGSYEQKNVPTSKRGSAKPYFR